MGESEQGHPAGTQPIRHEGLVVQHGANRYLVEVHEASGPRQWACSIAGRLRQGPRQQVRLAVIGDRVRIEAQGSPERAEASIVEVLPRRNAISRPAPAGGARRGAREQLVIANLDRLWVIASVAQPPLNLYFVDRVLAAAAHQGVPAGLILNKIDLLDEEPDGVVGLYRGLGYPVHLCSARDGRGVEQLAAAFREGIGALVGRSGVGKTSLLEAVQPGLRLKTGEVSPRRGHGRHTTTVSRLYRLDGGGYLADTPGMREFGLWGMVRADLAASFVEFPSFAADCRFRDCLHVREPGCAVRAAAEDGRIDPGRYRHYLELLKELPERRPPRSGGASRGM